MSRTGKILLLVAAMTLAAAPLCAQDGSGGTRSIFTVGAGSRAIGMGGAFVALGDDPSALYYNPAALRSNRYFGVMVNHIQLFSGFSDASYDFLGLVYPTMSYGSVGLGFMTAGTGGIREFDYFSRELGEISYRESQAILGYGFDLPWQFFGKYTLGTNIKVLLQRVGDYSDTGTGLDFGFLYKPSMIEGFTIGANLQDIVGAETKLVAVSEKVYRTIMLGAGYTRRFDNGSALNLAVQLDMPEYDDSGVRAGAEFIFKNTLSVRVGFDSEQITAGIGVLWHGYQVDYGYFSRAEAGSSHPISLSARIGPSLDDRERVRAERLEEEAEERVRRIFTTRISEHVQTADRLSAEGSYEQALDELKIAREYDPTNEEVSRKFEEVQQEIVARQAEATRESEKSIMINQHFQLGMKYYGVNDYVLARTEWLNILDLDPEDEGARDYLARTDEKITEQVTLHSQKARDFERRGQLAVALTEWNVVRTLDPEHEEMITSIERLKGRLEDMSRSYKTTSRRLEIVELFEQALGHFSEGSYEQSKSTLQELLRKDPNHAEAQNLLLRVNRRLIPLSDEEKEEIKQLYIAGMKHFTQGNYTAAIEEWRKILRLDPDNESVQKNIEEAQLRLGRGDDREAE